jgi:hypothetical protein
MPFSMTVLALYSSHLAEVMVLILILGHWVGEWFSYFPNRFECQNMTDFALVRSIIRLLSDGLLIRHQGCQRRMF